MSLFQRQIFSNKKTISFIIDGLVAYYKMDSNSNDSYGTNHGIDTSMTYGGGKIGDCAIFNNSSSQIVTSLIPLTGSPFSFSCWVKLQNTSNGIWFSQGSTSSNSPIISIGQLSTTKIEIVNRDNSMIGLNKQVTVPVLSIGTWYHVVWVCTTNQSRLYLNGVLYDTTNFTANTGTFNAQRFGVRRRIGDDSRFNGSLDELSLYNIALTQSDVSALYNAGDGITL